jgi:putative SOS response-associated peptidase YedK
MCGRYTLATQLDLLADRFGFETGSVSYQPRYNVAPGQDMPVVISDGGGRLAMMRWGLVPYWAREESIGYRMINARAETLAEKPSFKKSLQSRRCLVLADGFYEWRKQLPGKRKTPMRFVLRNRRPFGFAGLWDSWRQPDGEPLRTFTIITTSANEIVRPVHDRMPVILRPEDEDLWLNGESEGSEVLTNLLRPFAAELLEAYEVSWEVSSPSNDSPACIEPVP